MSVEQSVAIRSTIPSRLDRLGWSPFHTRMVAGLVAAWILDGLQITISSSVTGVLISPDTLGMTSTEVGLIASVYLVGEMVGALVFGRPDRRGDHGNWRDHRAGLGIKAEGKSLETVTKPLTATASSSSERSADG
jgi:MFS family permease